MSTTYSEDHPDRKVEATVDASPVEGLDKEPSAIEAKVVTAPAAKPAKKSSAKPTTKAKG